MSEKRSGNEKMTPIEEHARRTTSACLDEQDYADVYASACHPRERLLLDWLRNKSADSALLLDWLKGEFVIFRQEGPSMAILQSLPPVNNPLEPAVRNVLARRVGEAIEWLASHSQARAQWATGTWVELFIIARRLGDPVLSVPITQLRRTFDAEKGVPFAPDKECVRTFTRLVIKHQRDNELENRWTTLIEGNDDPVLKASLFDAVRGLLSMPHMVDDERFDDCIGQFCRRVDRAVPSDKEKREKTKELERMLKTDYHIFTAMLQIALVRMWRKYKWLPKPDFSSEIIAFITDIAPLAQFTQRMKAVGDKHAEMAKARYGQVCKDARLSPRLREYVLQKSREERLGKSMVTGAYNRKSFRKFLRVGLSKLARKRVVDHRSINLYARQLAHG